MSQRIHDPTETGLPEHSTTSTLRKTLEKLKDGPDFHITAGIGESLCDGAGADPLQSGAGNDGGRIPSCPW